MIPSSAFSSKANHRSNSPHVSGDHNIRPRNRRLISTGEQELVSTSGTSAPNPNRGQSPIPQTHPSRGFGDDLGRNGISKDSGLLTPGRDASRGAPNQGNWGGGWMSSVSSFTSSVFSGWDANSSSSKSKSQKNWGPESLPRQHDAGIGAGSTAEREAIVRRKKMTRVLEGRDEPPSTLDTNGNFKHRSSMEEQRPGSSQNDGGDALVYVHHVQPNDTLAGVVLRYNCQPAVFRKANGFWPNDSIQTRKTVVLPVDACAIRGRPCDPPSPDGSGVDLLAPTPGIEEPPSISNGTAPWPSVSGTYSSNTSAERGEEADPDSPWIHVRWVLLDSSPSAKPVQIARMPRKTLGYFPPRRRKSQTTISTLSTPRASLEIFPSTSDTLQRSRTSSINNSSPAGRRTSALGPRPSVTSVPGSYFPPPANMIASPPPSSSMSRRDSSISRAPRQPFLHGPGGVGTLGPKVSTPGPGKDSMNSWVKKHLPGIAIDGLPSSSINTSETAHFGFTDNLTPINEGPSYPHGPHQVQRDHSGVSTPSGLNFGNPAAAIEGYIRRLAAAGANAVPGTPRGGTRGHEADLIELLDGAGSDDGKGFELNPGAVRGANVGGSGREDLEGMVRGRGRVGSKSGKKD